MTIPRTKTVPPKGIRTLIQDRGADITSHHGPSYLTIILNSKQRLPFVTPYTRRRNLLITAELLIVGIYFGFVNAKA